MTLSIRRAGRFLIDAIYPPGCVLCGCGNSYLCAACETGLSRADGARCSRCWLPVMRRYCRACADHLPAFDTLRSGYRYEGKVRDLIHAIKFKRQSVLTEPLAAVLAKTIEEHVIAADALVPVPLLTMRRRDRGFNQAELLARGASQILGMPVADVLQRRGNADAQALARSAEQRRRNVTGAFTVKKGSSVAGMHLLLVDDVATTGATLDACARVLLNGGARSVSAVTLARED